MYLSEFINGMKRV